MSETERVEIELTDSEKRLTPREYRAYRAWESMNQPRLSPENHAKFFSLYLQGTTLDEIVRLNKGYSLGQICHECIVGDWIRLRDEYLENLMLNVRSIVQQTTLESVKFLADQLSAVHKRNGEMARKYLMSGDESAYESFGIDGIKGYERAVQTLATLTGQNTQSQALAGPGLPTMQSAQQDKALTPSEAANIIQLAALNKAKEGK